MSTLSGKHTTLLCGAVCLIALCVVGASAASPIPSSKNIPVRTEAQPPTASSAQQEKKPSAVPQTPTPPAPAAEQHSAAIIPPELMNVVNVVSAKVAAWQQLVPQAVVANLQNVKAGALSVFYGPIGFAVETSQVASFWTGSAPCCLSNVLKEAKANALRRFEFSLGSFVAEALLFLVINGVTRRSRALKRNLARPTHVNWLKLVVLASIPTGLFDVAAVVAAVAAAPATVLLPALFVGKLARPYITTYILWAVRWASSVGCIAGPLQQFTDSLKAWTAEIGTSAAGETSTQILVTAAAAGVVILVLAIANPSDEPLLDEETMEEQ